MSVLIKDMKKPKSCYAITDGEAEFCPFVNTDDDCVLLLKKGMCTETWEDQYSKCPLVEVQYLCEDAVSKKAAIDALNAYEDVVDTASQVFTIRGCKKAITNLPSVQPEPCEDAVSRKAVYEAMVEKGQRSRRYRLGETWELNGTEIREALDTVPSVTPKRKTGKWIDQKGGGCCCSECGRYALDEVDGNFIHVAAKSNYCPNCGADMNPLSESYKPKEKNDACD